MRPRRCTIDSSCLIALDHLNLVPQLSILFSVVLVPKAVREELFKRRATKDRLQLLFATYAFFQRCDGYEPGAVDFLVAERTRQGLQDRGEVEAVVQASQFGAIVIVDDSWGRKLAERSDLEFHGTFWILQRFHKLQLLSSTALHECFAALYQREARLPWDDVDKFLLKIGQPALLRH